MFLQFQQRLMKNNTIRNQNSLPSNVLYKIFVFEDVSRKRIK